MSDFLFQNQQNITFRKIYFDNYQKQKLYYKCFYLKKIAHPARFLIPFFSRAFQKNSCTTFLFPAPISVPDSVIPLFFLAIFASLVKLMHGFHRSFSIFRECLKPIFW